MNIQGYEKAEVLAALFNATEPEDSRVAGEDPKQMTKEEARSLLESGQTYFEMVRGRVLKVLILGNEVETCLFNNHYHRWNGKSLVAEKIIESLRR